MSTSRASGAHALVFGASGLIGWALVDELLKGYPENSTFSKVAALVNRPLNIENSYWPTPDRSRPELQLISGINLASGTIEEFTEVMKEKVVGIEAVTHVYYFAYKQDDNSRVETAENAKMLERAMGALTALYPKLEFIVIPSGSKGYGIHLETKPFKAPYTEDMILPNPNDSSIHYAAFQHLLTEKSKGKQWTWCDVRPDAVVGFAPTGSTYNLTAHWATYLSLYANIESAGSSVAFPGTENAYNSLFNEASSSIIARLAIWASLHPEVSASQIINVADSAKAESMRDRWPKIASWFGLVGVGPASESSEAPLLPSQYAHRHEKALKENGIGILIWKAEFLDSYGFYLDFDRQMSLEKCRRAGFEEEKDPNEGWFDAFEKFRGAGMILGQWRRVLGFEQRWGF
ncbi:uncharacterized protein BDZ99DRAFT_445317 [Mytilinidion resinicola]|uniref:PRISE-like Rossmann-fold domain-containing protein n=1 Tax=Mytilinidion resinicola TaxID=574789 RepID=A0A6A6YJL4_9PEZI|nr:uncharacterized protein BDZ99DRAFT_445317 [Mytilinidion resinicola]KAF2808145.1 hypothetical protein BDZ99DRAFT_445317 [Mytilinidion resinicola]